MNDYDEYIKAIENLEEVEKAIITESRYRKCCTTTLEILKTILKNVKNNINAKNEEKQKSR